MLNKGRTGRRRSLWITLFVTLQVLVLTGIALSYYAVGWFGQEIRLRTVPIDPRDIFYGDYVTLSYEISRLEKSLWKEPQEPKRGDTVYVVVKPSADGFAVPVGAYKSKPTLAKDESMLKGIVEYGLMNWNNEKLSFSVNYGIERYYVPEGTGKQLEKEAAHLIVRVNAAPWGQPAIKSIEAKDDGVNPSGS